MDGNIRDRLIKVLRGELRYTSSNLAFNMLISKMQKRIKDDPASIEACMTEMDEFLAKYPIVAKVDLANIAVL